MWKKHTTSIPFELNLYSNEAYAWQKHTIPRRGSGSLREECGWCCGPVIWGGGGHGFSMWKCGEKFVATRHRRGDTSCRPPLPMVLLLEMWFVRYRVFFTLIVKRGEVKTFRSICSPSWSHWACTKNEQQRAMLEQHEYQKIPAVRPVVVEKLIILWSSIPAHFSRFPKSQINSVFGKNR